MRYLLIVILLLLPVYFNCVTHSYNYEYDEKRYCSPTIISYNGNALIGTCARTYRRNYNSANPTITTGSNNIFIGCYTPNVATGSYTTYCNMCRCKKSH
jgi:hypothetical protein